MVAKTIAALKSDMPLGVNGSISGEDIHNTIDTLEFMTTQKVNTRTASYTAVVADNRTFFVFNSSTAVTLTLPSSIPAEWECAVFQIGSGQVTIAVTGGNLRHPDGHTKTSKAYAQAYLKVYANSGTSPQVAFTGDTAP